MRYAISDIHGCTKTFRALLDQIDLQKEDELFLLGDYVDRGPDSYGTLQLIWWLIDSGYRVTCLRGNHEEMWLNELRQGQLPENLPAHEAERTAEWMNALPYYHHTPGYFLVHAGLNFQHPNPLQDTESMIWLRYWYADIDRDWLGDNIIVHGHTPEREAAIRGALKNFRERQRICIDGGCSHTVWGMGYLCALNLDTEELTSLRNVGE